MAGTLDQSFTTNNANAAIADTSGDKYRSQQITVGLGGDVLQVDLYLQKTGNPVDNLKIEIWSDDGSNKPNVKVSDTATLDCSTLTTSLAWYSISITNSGTYSISDLFHIVCYRDSLDASNYPQWGADTAQGYADGVAWSSADASTWVGPLAADFNFKTYMGAAASGYNNMLLMGVG